MNDFTQVNFKWTFRDYQQRVLDNSRNYLTDGRIHIVAAPGSGKTILGLELIRRLNNPCIVFSPTTTIRDQWIQRFKESFLNDDLDYNDYVSNNLLNVSLLNSITYQALYSAMNKIKVESEEEEIDYSSFDLFKLMKDNNIKTICLDEAHHLQNEWQKALEKFVKGLDKDVKIVALTATPPYDANPQEWERYKSICGEIDEEIFVPELVKQNTLCPHQDFVYFNYPTQDEINDFRDYYIRSKNAINDIGQLECMKSLCDYLNNNYQNMLDQIYSNAKEYIALLILFNKYNFEINIKLFKNLTNVKIIPNLTPHYAEIAIQFLLDNNLLNETYKKEIINILRFYHVYERKQVYFELNESLKRRLMSSIGKIDSIIQIVKTENESMKEKLRMLILTDYIKKESINKIGLNEKFDDISTVSIFETLRRSFNINIGILTGGLVILPNSTISYLEEKFKKLYTSKSITNTEYSIINFKGSNKDKVLIVSDIFEKGLINILIGTKSLLGEGWDSPCINTLILASFVGSFMLSNQMRGRAIRTDKKNPDKVSNIWHLITIEPQSLLQNKLFNNNTSNSLLNSCDYDTLVKRFDCFVGPNYETNEIESGIDRLSFIKPPYNEKGIEEINNKMVNYALQRSSLKEKWMDSLENNANISLESNIPTDRKMSPFTFINIGFLTILLTINSLCISLMINLLNKVNMNFGNIFLLIIAIILVILFTTLSGINFNRVLALFNPTNTIKTFSKCILKTLKDIDVIKSNCNVKASSDELGLYVHVDLINATIHEQNIFNNAIKEFLSPIENPRYIIIKKFYKYYNYKYSFACPTIIGKSKEIADIFRKYMQRKIGKFDLVYTRNDKGRAFIIKCRKKSYITYNAKVINNKHKVSRWE